MLSHLKTIGLTVLLPFLVPAITPARTAIADARAATDVEIVGVKIGLGGAFRTGKWTPMTVQLKSESDASGTLQVITLDGDGMQAAFRPDASRVEIRAGQTASVPLLIRVAAVQPWLEVRFVADNGDVTDWQPNTDELGRGTLSSQQVLLQLGKPIGLADALAVRRRVAHEAMTVAKVEEAAQMPTQWLGYDACDVISLSTSDLTFLNRVTDEQRAALRDWVRRGGCLIFCVGSQGEAVLGAEGQWKDFAPGQFQRVTTMRNPGRIESFAGENYPITLNVDSNTGFPLPLSASVLADASGNILAYEGNDPLNQPLVVHATEGLGQILYVAVDLDASPLDDWNGRRHFVANLLDLGLGREGGDSSSGTKGQVTHLGYRDLGGQLRAALDRYP
ncbi:MAG: hypothetical protein KDA99_28725, partial [Planctomycetales bacterium]|nr:hypothetical protein [Planctomycetales bacterium]